MGGRKRGKPKRKWVDDIAKFDRDWVERAADREDWRSIDGRPLLSSGPVRADDDDDDDKSKLFTMYIKHSSQHSMKRKILGVSWRDRKTNSWFLMAALDNLNFHSETEDRGNVDATTNIIYQYSSGEETADCVVRAPKTNIGYDLMYPQTPTNPDVVKTLLDCFVSLNLKLGQSNTLITCDQAIYGIIKGLVRSPVPYKESPDSDHHEKLAKDDMPKVLKIRDTVMECMRNPFASTVAAEKLVNIAKGEIFTSSDVVDSKQLGLDVIAHARSTDNAEKIISPKILYILTCAGQQKQRKKRQDSVKQIVSEEGTVTRALCFTRELKPLAKNGVNILV
ncbi:hypothetical protein GQR58_025224 [Nymphon striatum]|nr:hypothetical protein GQR58_025224 [Nymphon striatum]